MNRFFLIFLTCAFNSFFFFIEANEYELNLYTYDYQTQTYTKIENPIIPTESKEGLLNFLKEKQLINIETPSLTAEEVLNLLKEKKIFFVTCFKDPDPTDYKYVFYIGMELYGRRINYPISAYEPPLNPQTSQDPIIRAITKGSTNIIPQKQATSDDDFVFFDTRIKSNGKISHITFGPENYLQNSIGGGGPT